MFETGLGGRLDSTNIVRPGSVVITPIGFDHQQHLGKTLTKIAAEKAGIIKPGCDIFLAKMHRLALKTISEATDNSNRIFSLEEYIKTTLLKVDISGINFRLIDKINNETDEYYIPTPADYQIKNIALAYLTARNYCQKNNIYFNKAAVKDFMSNKTWPGRLQLISKNPNIIFDVSHNLPGIKETLRSVLKYINPQKTHLLLGIVNDKDVYGITKVLSGKFKKIIITEPITYRKQNGEVLVDAFRTHGEKTELIKDLKTAFEKSKKNLKADETLLALGSHYLIGSLITS
jgi:dihydrofolate synthase/folylpolyglutamate synthase